MLTFIVTHNIIPRSLFPYAYSRFARLQEFSALLRAASQAFGQPNVQVPATRAQLRVIVFHRHCHGRRLRRATTAAASSTVNNRNIEACTTATAVDHPRIKAVVSHRSIEAAAITITTITIDDHRRFKSAVTTAVGHRRPWAAQTLVTGHRTGIPRVHRRVFGRDASARHSRPRFDVARH